jgi:hypothetical protein
MSNLTQFFGIQSTGGTVASSVTGKAAEALTAGDGLRLNEHGDFIKSAKNDLRQVAFTQDYGTSKASVAGNELDLNASSAYGRYTPEFEVGSGFIASDGTYIQLFYKEQSNTSTNYLGFRSFDQETYDQPSLWFKNFVSAGSQSNFYSQIGAEYREFYKDSNYIHIAVTLLWMDGSSVYRNQAYTLRLTRSSKVLAVFASNGNDGSQSSANNNGHINGSGSAGILANGVLVRSFQLGTSAGQDRTGSVRLNSIVYDHSAPSSGFSSANNYSGAAANYNDAVHSLHLHDHDTRTFLTFEAPVLLSNSKLVKKHVIAANGAITTTNVNTAFVLSNWAEAKFNRFSQIYQISSSIYAAVYPESTTTISIQKFTYDGNTTLTQSGSKIVLTMPSDVTIYGADNDHYNYYYSSRLADNDPKQLYIQASNDGTTPQPFYNIISINLVAGTLNFARQTYGLSSGRTTRGGNIAIGANKALVLQNRSYQNFGYQRYELPFFTSELRTKDIVAVALADATAGQTDATAALYSGVTSTATLPSTHYATKNGQSYVLDISGSELPSERLNKAPSKLKWIARRTDNTALSAYQHNAYMGADWYNSASFNQNTSYNIRNQTAAGGTGTSILKVAGSGMFKSNMFFGHRYGTSSAITSRFGLYIDDVLVWDNGQNSTHHGSHYYNGIPQLTGVIFTTGFELKVLYANTASYAWNGAVQTVEMT